MATRYPGQKSYLGIARESNTLVDLTEVLRGLDSISLSEVEDTREIPGYGGVSASQLLGYIEGTGSFGIDDNSVTHPLFFGGNGRRFDVSFGPEGNASGAPSQTAVAYVEATLTGEARGVRRWAITLTVDGLITHSTY